MRLRTCFRLSTLAPGVRRAAPRVSARRGFTLIELMVVIAMVGILSALAVRGVSTHFRSARSVDARSGVSAVAVAQEMYRAEFGIYADVSPSRSDNWYPGDPKKGNVKYAWKQPGHVLWNGTGARPGWRDLEVPLGEFHGGGCTTDAGGAGELATSGGETIAGVSLGYTPQKNWYVVVCATDLDTDGDFRIVGGSPLVSEVIVQDPTEY